MPRNNNLKKVMVIGSGPIIIGQAAEFDYAGTQACRALKEEGVEVVLINSNPATIMTDAPMADRIYMEPLTEAVVESIMAKERPDALLAGMGGQTALNLALALARNGVLDRYGVALAGTSLEAIEKGEDRERFRQTMRRIHQPVIDSEIINDVSQGLAWAKKNGYPVIVRPAFTLGGSGGGIAADEAELQQILPEGLAQSAIHQVLLEKSIKGWKEIEYEVMRDAKGNCICVCNMENIDPVGIHTGDSIVVAPSQTLSDKEYQMLRSASFAILEAVGIEGGCNVQFALNPDSFEYAVIEINPRVSRSSALASKATGYPIAKVAAKIALGYHLDEIQNDVTGETTACFEPALDYVVVKIPKWPFDKFYHADRRLGTKMMATGEIMALGSNFQAAFLKGIRSLESNAWSLNHPKFRDLSLKELRDRILAPDDERIFALAEIIRRDYRMDKLHRMTGIDPFFLDHFRSIIREEERLKLSTLSDLTRDWLLGLKRHGFSDKGIASLLGTSPADICRLREAWSITPAYKMVDTCAGEFDAKSPYYYSTYEEEDEVAVSERPKVMVLGSGPIRIGQGIEFDYASVHCVQSLRRLGFETLLINNNPETVSTDFNISDKLYFEPLTEEDVWEVWKKERPMGVILQFGGQTAIKLAHFLKEMGIPTLGTTSDQIDLAEDREQFEALLESLGVNRPKGKAVWTLEEGIQAAKTLGFPVLVRPSFVLGGQGMEITHSEGELQSYLLDAFARDPKNPVLIDKYLQGMELEVDAISDGEDILIPGIMEHLERSGVHSGDSITRYPSLRVSAAMEKEILAVTQKLSRAIGIHGMINIQFIVSKESLYVIEVNPRASRTVPYLSKVSGIPIVDLATRVMLGEKLKDMGWGRNLAPKAPLKSVKVPVFSTQKLPNVEVSLGPEMKSTGEAIGIGSTWEEAIYKGFLAAGMYTGGGDPTILATIGDAEKPEFLELAQILSLEGFRFIATEGTAKALKEAGIDAQRINRIGEPAPTILDLLHEKKVRLMINTPTKGNDSHRDGFHLRRAAIERGITTMTSLDTLRAFASFQKRSHAQQMELHPLEALRP
ncbi:Carbamoyl-phosphate synthase large chain [Clostridiaceae bacterium JG1575]|nr:Carbamoyl-phosphate synthase large chain [Clostridiaceae bacterium JG1575]